MWKIGTCPILKIINIKFYKIRIDTLLNGASLGSEYGQTADWIHVKVLLHVSDVKAYNYFERKSA